MAAVRARNGRRRLAMWLTAPCTALVLVVGAATASGATAVPRAPLGSTVLSRIAWPPAPAAARAAPAASDSTWVENTVRGPGLGGLGSIACASADVCVVIGQGDKGPIGVWATSDGGLSWSDVVPPDVADLESVACATGTSSCWAVGRLPGNDGGVIDATTDGGATWSAEAVPPAISTLTAVSCADAEHCVAVGGEVDNSEPADAVTSDGGATWTAHAFRFANSEFLDYVSCGTVSTCVATGFVGGDGEVDIVATTDGGTSWQEGFSTHEWGDDPWSGLSCAGPADCWVAATVSVGGPPLGAAVLVTTDGGTNWSVQTLPSSVLAVLDVSCPSTRDCWASVVTNLEAPSVLMETTDGGAAWRLAPAAVEGGVGSVTCPSTTVCDATAGLTDVLTTRNASGAGCTGAAAGALAGSAPAPDGGGYWLASAAGGVLACGDAPFYGSPASEGVRLQAPVVGIAATGDGCGYYELAADGTVYPFGPCAQRFPAVHGGARFVGIAADPSSAGYWLVSGDGGVFAVGARYYGSVPGLGISTRSVVGIATAPAGGGYWLAAADGGVFSFGLRYHGSLPGLGVHVGDVVSITASPSGSGYLLAGADGGVFALGPGVRYCGSASGHAASAVAAIASYPFTPGYWLVERGGLALLDAPFDGGASSPPRGPTRCG
jgi:hypothetical protein